MKKDGLTETMADDCTPQELALAVQFLKKFGGVESSINDDGFRRKPEAYQKMKRGKEISNELRTMH